ncbi:MAG TPA: hypothetical protein VHQ39_13925 [Dongiaceae bacterium]|nr:hypothetical protein [Dongiaceae bacterium]
MITVTAAQIDEVDRHLTEVKRSYLQRFGWQETSSTPGAYWLWRRDFADLDVESLKWWENACASKPPLGNPSRPVPYGVITAPTDLAVSITRRSLDRDENCEACGMTLVPGDLHHRCRDGEPLCESCAPSWADVEKQTKESIAEGDDDERLKRTLEACAARRAEGLSMDDKMLVVQ